MSQTTERPTVKCVVWDLDNTLWNGVLLEDPMVTIREDAVQVIRALDDRGILSSIASRNDRDTALAKLREFGILDYFLYPAINWESKSRSIQAIASSFNFGIDTIAFVDDQPFERDEVRFAHPDVRCIDAVDIATMLDLPDLIPRFVTADSRQRRAMYTADIQRKTAEDGHQGTPEMFLASLGMRFAMGPCREDDLQRAEELTLRTNQLNATGYTYSYDELNRLRASGDHDLWIASLEDKYGTYGKIGLALVERGHEIWTLKLLLMSCRVMSRGVGTVMLNHIMRCARDAGVRLQAEFVATNKNRAMYVAYKFAGFREIASDGSKSVLETDFAGIQPFPAYITVDVAGCR